MRRKLGGGQDLAAKTQIAEFLNTSLPEEFMLGERDQAELLDRDGMEALMLERAPFFFIHRAVAIADEAGCHSVWGIAPMTIERSAGHFPDRPIVPLIELCRAMAQTGMILVSLHGEPHQAPIGISSGPSKALAKELIDAPVDVLTKVSMEKNRLGLFVVNGIAHVEGKQIGALEKMVYALVSREQLTGSGR